MNAAPGNERGEVESRKVSREGGDVVERWRRLDRMMVQDRANVGWRVAAVVALLLAAALFVVRGPARGMDGPQDWSLIYGSTRAWLLGESPYSGETAARVWREAGGQGEAFVTREQDALLLYPPTSLVVLSPAAAIRWPASVIGWTLLGTVAYLAAGALSLRLAGLVVGSTAWLAGATAILVFGAAHTSLAMGQTAAVCGFGVVAGLVLLRAGRPGWAGVALALAALVKPQLAGVFALYGALVGGWACVASVVAVGGAAGVIGVGRVWMAGTPWLEQLRENVRVFATLDAGSPVGPYAYQLINLHMPLHVVIDSPGVVSAIVWLVVALLLAAYVARGWRRPESAEQWLMDASLLAVVTLLPLYHRYYDAVILVLVFALVTRLWSCGRYAPAAALSLMMLPLTVPLPVMVQVAVNREVLSEAWVTGAGRLFVLGSHAWALVGIGCVLVLLDRRTVRCLIRDKTESIAGKTEKMGRNI
jgi:hypothetical protein